MLSSVGLSTLFLLLYVIMLILIGYFASRKETEEGFMLADRKLGGLGLAATMSAGWFDGSILAIYIAYVYQFGISALWIFVGFSLGFLLLRLIAPKIKKRAAELNAYSMPEYFSKIFGRANGMLISALLVVEFTLLLIVNLIISGQVLSQIFPLAYWQAVIIGGVIVLSYLLLAGFKAVVRTDFFQLAMMFVMGITVTVYLFAKGSALDISFGDFGVGNIVGFLLLGGLGAIVAPDLWQRLFAAKNVRESQRGLGWSALVLPVLAVLVGVVGIATKQAFPSISPNDALVVGFSHLLPFGLKEFGMILLYAVTLSSSDTITFVVSSILTRDVKNYGKSKESMSTLTRMFMLGLIAFAVLVAVTYKDILSLGFSLASVNLALVPVVVGSLYWNLDRRAVFWSLVLSCMTVLVLFVTHMLSPETASLSLPVSLVSLVLLQIVLKKT